ncbi:uncharacterized protein [Macrobrachium rosenbergii]|uniref:uncharacterized protein n=1 Tax=Macrobrachium rosenbergii TaxID=79674 RepID=UPI0034D50D82
MDNAPYHHSMQQEKYPTSSWKKEEIKHWLIENGEQPSAEAGHKIVRLPPYHCQYKPIELIWAQVKSCVAKKNTFKVADLKILVQEALNNVTEENWKNAVGHVEKIQKEDAHLDLAVDELVDTFNIGIADSSEDELSE